MKRNLRNAFSRPEVPTTAVANTVDKPIYKDAAGEYVMAPMSLIDPDPEQPRKTFTDEYLDQLGQSMEINGQRQAITLRRKSDGRLVIKSGERRWRAAGRREWSHIKAVIEDDSINLSVDDQAAILRGQRAENVDRDPLTLWEDIETCERYLELTGKTQKEVAADLGLSEVKLSKMRKIFRAPESIQYLVKLGICSNLNTLGCLSELVGLLPEWSHEVVMSAKFAGEMPAGAETLFAEKLKQAKSASVVLCGPEKNINPSTDSEPADGTLNVDGSPVEKDFSLKNTLAGQSASRSADNVAGDNWPTIEWMVRVGDVVQIKLDNGGMHTCRVVSGLSDQLRRLADALDAS